MFFCFFFKEDGRWFVFFGTIFQIDKNAWGKSERKVGKSHLKLETQRFKKGVRVFFGGTLDAEPYGRMMTSPLSRALLFRPF